MKEEKKGLKRFLSARFVTFIVAFVFLIAAMVASFVLYLFDKFPLVSLILFVVSFSLAVLCLIYVIVLYRKINNVIYKELFIKTKSNYESISDYNYSLDDYVDFGINELKQLNESVDSIKKNFKNAVFYENFFSYKDLDLEKSDKYDDYVITKRSFVKNIPNFIEVAKVFRNAFLLFTYDVDDYKLIDQSDKSNLIKAIMERFAGEEVVIAEDTDVGFLVFVPNIDSLNALKGKLEEISKTLILTKYDNSEARVIALRASCAIYPYSRIDNIVSDLRYADRRGQYVNIYLPNFATRKNDVLPSEAVRVNVLSKVIDEFGSLSNKLIGIDEYRATLIKYATTIKEFLNFESVGIVRKDVKDEKYDFVFENSSGDNALNNSGDLDAEFFKTVSESVDDDDSLLFFSRNNVYGKLGRFLDIYGIKSGYFYLIRYKNEPFGILYFLNFTKDLTIDNYTRESLVVFSYLLSTIYSEFFTYLSLEKSEKNLKDLLSISGYEMYSVDSDTYKLTYVSEHLKDLLKGAKVGETCYKALYGLKAPCDNCPLKKGFKKVDMIDGVEYMTRSFVDTANKKRRDLFLEPISKYDITRQRFDPNLLVNSSYSLVSSLNDKFTLKSKGYVLFMRIENSSDLLSVYKEDGFNEILRNFIDKAINDSSINNDLYLYSIDTLAMVLSEYGRNELFDLVEKLYDISMSVVSGSQMAIQFTYIALAFPLDYATVYDFFRSAEIDLKSEPKNYNHQLILSDSNIRRSASRNEYILSLLNDAFVKRNFDTRILPIITKDSTSLYGGEVLLRLKDELRNVFFNAGEFINVAIANQKMNEFSNLLIEQVGKMYKQYGATLFRMNSLDRISLNIDSSYFTSPNFLNNMVLLMREYAFEKGFLAFEINESDIAEHFDLITSISKKVTNYDITLVCDQYTGKYVSLLDLKKMGFSEIKISRSIVKDIDNSPSRLQEMKLLASEAKDAEMKVTLVGIERKEQFNIIKDDQNIDFLQGFYFYKPMETEEFLSFVRSGGKTTLL
jgi:EAL domain-containing protein (putative c-di-GMP-specific phosphodiesterase class I)